jgi:protein O-GlcNAc transferase
MERVVGGLWSVAFKLSNKAVHTKGEQVWIDVGAHSGERTFFAAAANPNLLVFAFEPNLKLISKRMGLIPNFVALPFAVSESDGCLTYYENIDSFTNSTLPLDPEGLGSWPGDPRGLSLVKTSTVPSIRLDTFLDGAEVDNVDWLKIDTQGTDLPVIRSAGKRIENIQKITAEVKITPNQLYSGETHRREMVEFMESSGFKLVREEVITYGQYADLTFENHKKS